MLDKEKRIKEERIREATSKNLIGLEGKLGVILKYLGQPIKIQGYGSQTSTEFADVYDYLDDKEDEIPTMDEDEEVRDIGYFFDGLSNGVHMEISYNFEEQKILLRYKGFVVYTEEAGDVTCYVPLNEWELKVENFYQIAKKRQDKNHKIIEKENKQEEKREKWNFLDRLKRTWGI